MELNDTEYLKLFKQVQGQNDQNRDNYGRPLNQNHGYNMLKETPDYNNFNQQNEVYRHNYSGDINEFNIETRINGQNINEIRQQEKENKLNEIMEIRRQEKENKLNEIMELRRQEKLNEIKKSQEQQVLNEKINWNSDVVTLEMFNKARYNSMMQITKRL